MIEIRTLQPNDPLPEGHSVTLMRRFDEDAPESVVIEMIVTNPDHSEETSIPTSQNGGLLAWDQAVAVAQARAEEEGLRHISVVDRTEGARARVILAHHGDHSVGSSALDDDDIEHGEHGSDMRDRGPDGAPRRF